MSDEEQQKLFGAGTEEVVEDTTDEIAETSEVSEEVTEGEEE
jgi:hypothetical protein